MFRGSSSSSSLLFGLSFLLLALFCLFTSHSSSSSFSSLTSSSASSSSLLSSSFIQPVSAGALEDLLAEGIDMLSGQAARDAADRQLRESRANNKNGRNPESCPRFTCENKQHKFRHKKNYKPDANGCGSYGFKIHSKWHESCCDVHDRCYGTCGKTRDECDKEFKQCMNKQCAKKSKKEKEDCEGQAQMFFTGTRSLGCQAYLDSQKVACDCYDPANDTTAATTTSASGVDATKKKDTNAKKPVRKNTKRPDKEEL